MRKLKRKYKRPRSPWNKVQIKEDQSLLKEYGLRRKKEIWLAQQILRNFRQRARSLAAEGDKEKEKVLIARLKRLGLLSKAGATIDDVLGMTINNVLSRRLQTIVFSKGLAKTPMEARQLIVHGHVRVGGTRMLFPSFIVPAELEGSISVTRAEQPEVHPHKVPAEPAEPAGVEA
ncbi:MAG: 30S ribosomal protein S4 [Candidatus Aenigmarchaeota archaeon]|nr:30S ribosomal protein S4 [Candidatus Aenigmarchaeota archaeon]